MVVLLPAVMFCLKEVCIRLPRYSFYYYYRSEFIINYLEAIELIDILHLFPFFSAAAAAPFSCNISTMAYLMLEEEEVEEEEEKLRCNESPSFPLVI